MDPHLRLEILDDLQRVGEFCACTASNSDAAASAYFLVASATRCV